jgi:Zn-dependent M28 family amino/carboxypeptidase
MGAWVFWILAAQDAPLEAAEETIRPEELRKHVEFLASDELRGRLCGSPGNDRAAEYIAGHYRALGAEPMGDPDDGGVRGYFQQFSFSDPRSKKKFRARNVVAAVRGSDEKLRREIVVVGAHFDHVGTSDDPDPGRLPPMGGPEDRIYNGADDNGSGTSGLLLLAQAFVRGGLKTRRTVLFVNFNGEEWGLKGSEAYLADPPFPLADHVAMINFDMLGRNPMRAVTVKGTGSSPTWEPWVKAAAESADLRVRQVKAATGSTDFHSFLARKIPSIGFFTEFHADYHAPGDVAEKLDYDRMSKIVRAAVRLTWSVAQAEERPPWTAPPGSK